MAVAQSTRRRAIILLVLTSIILITLDLQNSSAISGLRNVFGTIFRPVESTTRVITRPISNAWHGIFDYNDVLDENDRLREKVAQQEGATVAAAASVRLAQELLALNGLPTLAGINAVTAQVIGDSPTNFSQTIEINQGSESGIRVGMPVLNAAGLIGKITKVYGDRSVVMSSTLRDRQPQQQSLKAMLPCRHQLCLLSQMQVLKAKHQQQLQRQPQQQSLGLRHQLQLCQRHHLGFRR